MRQPEPYPRDVIDAKLDAIRADIGGLRSETRSEIARLDEKMDAGFKRLDEKIDAGSKRLDDKIDHRYLALEAKIDGVRGELRIWLLIIGFLVSPIMGSVGSRAVAAVWPVPPPAATAR